MASRSIQLGKIFGVRIGASPTWFFALFLIVFILSDTFTRNVPDSSGQATPYLLAVAAALLFFISIVVHELGHALMARRFGIQTTSVDLWLMGGFARLSRAARSAKEEFWVSIAGPLGTLLIVIVFSAVARAFWSQEEILDSMTPWNSPDREFSPGLMLVGWLIGMNALMLVLNLLPAFPLDGGRIVRAIVWAISGSRSTGTTVSGVFGQILALLLVVLGIIQFSSGDSFGAVWSFLLAWFIWSAARAAVVTSDFDEKIHSVTAGQLMYANPEAELAKPVWAHADESAQDAENNIFKPYSPKWVAVLEADARYIGVLFETTIRKAIDSGRGTAACRELIEPEFTPSIAAAAPLAELLSSKELASLGSVPVTDETGHMVGILTAERVQEALNASTDTLAS